MPLRDFMVVLFVMLLVLIGWMQARTMPAPPARRHEAMFQRVHASMPMSTDESDIEPIDAATRQNTLMNKSVPAPAVLQPTRSRVRKNVSFAPKKEVATYSKTYGDIKETMQASI